MITLYTTPPLWGLPSFSPACMKLETWLRMAKLPYKIDASLNFAIAPKGKIPFIDYEGQLIGDSTLIVEMFKSRVGIDLDTGLTSAERAISLAFRRMIKENIYWGGAYIRYGVEENWRVYREALINILKAALPVQECELFVDEVSKTVHTQMFCQGMGRHSDEEIFQIITADVQALSDFLADKPFFMGTQPTTLDATVYGYIGNFIKPPFKHPIVDYILLLENICQHYERMTAQFFSDLDVTAS